MTTEPSSDDPTPDETSPRPGRRRLWVSIAAAEVALLLLVTAAVAAFLDAAHTAQSARLDDYHAAARAEIAHREELETKYEARLGQLEKIIDLQTKLDDLRDAMRKSDCWSRDPCFGAVRWNRDNDRRQTLFDDRDDLLAEAAAAVGDIDSVATPADLWLLDLLDDNDAAAVDADLDAFVPRLTTLREDINESIAAVDEWSFDCTEDAVTTCAVDPDMPVLEEELGPVQDVV